MKTENDISTIAIETVPIEKTPVLESVTPSPWTGQPADEKTPILTETVPFSLLGNAVSPATEPEPDRTAPLSSVCVICSKTNGRANNEDSHLVLTLLPNPAAPPVILLAVSDGMGGHEFGEHASREALRRLGSFLLEQWCILPALNQPGAAFVPTPTVLRETLIQAVPLVNAHVQRIAQVNGWQGSGATLVVAVVYGNSVVVVNVGDSPAFHVRRADGMAHRLTEDHSLVGMLTRANLITPQMARVHEGKSQLEHFIGDGRLPAEIPVAQTELEPGDFLMVCSDGVSGSLSETFIAEVLLGHTELSDTVDSTPLLPRRGSATTSEVLVHSCARLLAAARDQGERDNQTIVLYRQGNNPCDLPERVVIPDSGPNGHLETEPSPTEWVMNGQTFPLFKKSSPQQATAQLAPEPPIETSDTEDNKTR